MHTFEGLRNKNKIHGAVFASRHDVYECYHFGLCKPETQGQDVAANKKNISGRDIGIFNVVQLFYPVDIFENIFFLHRLS